MSSVSRIAVVLSLALLSTLCDRAEGEVPPGLHRAALATIERDTYNIDMACEHDGQVLYAATNRAHDLRFTFGRDGVEFTPRAAGASAWRWRLSLAGIGYEGALHAIDASARPAGMRVDGGRIEYHHRLELGGGTSHDVSVVEWYVNDRRGLEQGFTLATRPERGRIPVS